MTVTVNHEGNQYTVENAATLSRAMIQQVGGAGHDITFIDIGYGLDDGAEANSKGTLVGKIKLESTGGIDNISKNIGLGGIFDETKANASGFANLLHRHLINAAFKHFLNIEPIDVSSGTVEVEYQTA